jgi:hypothetical protein
MTIARVKAIAVLKHKQKLQKQKVAAAKAAKRSAAVVRKRRDSARWEERERLMKAAEEEGLPRRYRDREKGTKDPFLTGDHVDHAERKPVRKGVRINSKMHTKEEGRGSRGRGTGGAGSAAGSATSVAVLEREIVRVTRKRAKRLEKKKLTAIAKAREAHRVNKRLGLEGALGQVRRLSKRIIIYTPDIHAHT